MANTGSAGDDACEDDSLSNTLPLSTNPFPLSYTTDDVARLAAGCEMTAVDGEEATGAPSGTTGFTRSSTGADSAAAGPTSCVTLGGATFCAARRLGALRNVSATRCVRISTSDQKNNWFWPRRRTWAALLYKKTKCPGGTHHSIGNSRTPQGRSSGSSQWHGTQYCYYLLVYLNGDWEWRPIANCHQRFRRTQGTAGTRAAPS